ncbi:MAG TPA: 4-alpha-glucanotransferase, partial [Oligoflexia bacterium]|nr:4-alpha-glucanotransferase [Oligoflexia bacterium]
MDQGNYEELLRVLAQDCWVELEYVQAGGNRIVHSAQDLRRHLTARGIPCDSVAQVRESITLRQRQQFARMLTPVFGCDPGAAPELRLRLPPGCTTFAAVHTCDNLPQPPMSGKIGDLTSLGSQEVDGSSFDEYKLRLPALTDWGLHDFSFTFANAAGAEKTCSTRAIVAPDRFWQPPGTRRFLGATTIQSSVRSRDPSHLGRGNYGDAVRAVQKLGSMGADFYSLGPLTMFDWPVDTPSATPFIPISVRLWAHHLIDVSEAMQRLQLTTALRNAHGAGTLAEITRLRSSRLLRATDYGVMLMRILREMYAEFCSAHRALHTQAAKDFEAFIAARGEKLLKPATFIALHDKFFPFGSTNDLWNWRNWPAEFQEWSSPQVIQYREESKADIEFVMFTQWLADHD